MGGLRVSEYTFILRGINMFKCIVEKDLELRLPNINDSEKLFKLIDSMVRISMNI